MKNDWGKCLGLPHTGYGPGTTINNLTLRKIEKEGHFVCACVNMGCRSATEAFSVNCLRSVPAFEGCFLELNDVYSMLRSTNMFFKVSRYFYDESEFIVASLSPLRGQSFLSKTVHRRQDGGWTFLRPNISRTVFEQEEKVSMIIFSLNNYPIDT